MEARPARTPDPPPRARLDDVHLVVAHGAPWTAVMPQRSCLTPIGEVTISEEDGVIVALDWGRGRDQARTPLLDEAVDQLQDYFDGKRGDFDLPLRPHGTAFQQRVWDALRTIPIGQTRSYGELAKLLGSSARAIGQANGCNPIPILIPCHRVLAAAGALGGYSGGDGPSTKLWLLEHERRMVASSPAASPQPELPLGSGRVGPLGTSAR
jgi:methylated-DNA-[protein]-cysteine S-methyltransferase